ncbi:PLC-like phosphodiesterase [Ceratocystis lukuohia]|uniref:PLC-like phosphodiesterase n=1 Tax=Ceratocystis lukuohia TaxID=2019550 RepID=A0ABR4MN00_9PEZI
MNLILLLATALWTAPPIRVHAFEEVRPVFHSVYNTTMNLTRATWEDTRMLALVMNHSTVDSLSSPSDCRGPNLTQSCFWYTQAAAIQSCYNEPATPMSNPEKRVIFGERKFSGTAYFSVINGTPYTMRLLKAESSSAIQVLVQFGGRNNHRGSGEVVYELVGSQDRTFKFRAYIDPQPRPYGSLHVMDVVHTDLPTQDVSNGDTIKLKFPGPGVRGRAMQWALVGSDLDGYWTSQNPPVAWMQASRYIIGDRKLKHVCMPGSHNAGMSTINSRTTFVTPSNAQNQILDIYQQLVRGSRWLDIRPCVGNSSNYMLCHYSNRFGANGISLNDAISQINLFMAEFPGELILIDLNADSAYDTSRGYSRLTSSQWDYVISHFQNIEQPCRIAGNLSETTMDAFIGDGKGCVATLKRSPIPQTNESFYGIYNENALPRFNIWSNTGSHTEMAIDQVRKLQTHRAIGHESDPSTQDTFHVLSWFITPPPLTYRRAWRYKQIVNHAGEALSTLSSFGMSEFSPYSFPNVLYVDALGMPHGGLAAGAFASRDQKFEASTPHMAAMAMAINYAIVSRNCYVGGHQISQGWQTMPDVLETLSLGGASETQGVQEVPEIQDVQQTQDAQEPQESQEGQNALEMQEFQQVHEAQDIQETQEAPEMQEIQQTQDSQEVQGTQGAPGTQDAGT